LYDRNDEGGVWNGRVDEWIPRIPDNNETITIAAATAPAILLSRYLGIQNYTGEEGQNERNEIIVAAAVPVILLNRYWVVKIKKEKENQNEHH
jgi:hypothetical protein